MKDNRVTQAFNTIHQLQNCLSMRHLTVSIGYDYLYAHQRHSDHWQQGPCGGSYVPPSYSYLVLSMYLCAHDYM